MRAIELSLNSKLFEVIGFDTIREHKVKSIKIDSFKNESGKYVDHVVVKIESYYHPDLMSHPNSEVLVDRSGRMYTTLEAAQRRQLRSRKKEMLVLLDLFKKSRQKYEEFKAKYKNATASNPEIK